MRVVTTGAGGVLHGVAAMGLGHSRVCWAMAFLAENSCGLDEDIGFGRRVRVVAGPAVLRDWSVRDFFMVGLFLMTRKTEIVLPFFEKTCLLRPVRVVAAGAAHLLFGAVLQGGVERLSALKPLFLLRVARITQLRAFLIQDEGSDDAVPLVTSLAFGFSDRRMHDFSGRKSGLLLLMAVHARFRGKAGRPLASRGRRRARRQPQDQEGRGRGKEEP